MIDGGWWSVKKKTKVAVEIRRQTRWWRRSKSIPNRSHGCCWKAAASTVKLSAQMLEHLMLVNTVNDSFTVSLCIDLIVRWLGVSSQSPTTLPLPATRFRNQPDQDPTESGDMKNLAPIFLLQFGSLCFHFVCIQWKQLYGVPLTFVRG